MTDDAEDDLEPLPAPVARTEFADGTALNAYLMAVGAQYQADRSPEPNRRRIYYAPRLTGQAWIAVERHATMLVALFFPECPCGFAAGSHIGAGIVRR